MATVAPTGWSQYTTRLFRLLMSGKSVAGGSAIVGHWGQLYWLATQSPVVSLAGYQPSYLPTPASDQLSLAGHQLVYVGTNAQPRWLATSTGTGLWGQLYWPATQPPVVSLTGYQPVLGLAGYRHSCASCRPALAIQAPLQPCRLSA